MAKKMDKERWTDRRDNSKLLLDGIIRDLTRMRNSNVLVGAEYHRCNVLMISIKDDLLTNWDERSKVSEVRFTEKGEDNE